MDQFLRDFEGEPHGNDYICCIEELDSLNIASNFKIVHNNIRSIEKNFDEFKLLLRTYREEFNIVVLTETFIIADLELFKIEGYTCIYNNGTFNRNDGVVVYLYPE